MSAENRTVGRGAKVAVWLSVVLSTIFVWRGSFMIDGQRYFSLFDDAMVSMRYARNLAFGRGFVWNAGEPPVEGYTNLLWTLVMSVLHLLPVPQRLVSAAVSIAGIAILALTVIVAWRMSHRFTTADDELGPSVVAILTALLYPLSYWTLRGMEVGLLALLLLYSVEQVLRLRDGFADSRIRLLIALACITLTRSDGIVPALAIGVCTVFADRHARLRTAVMLVAGPLLVFAAHLVFSRMYYGSFLPNTYYLKMSGVSLSVRVSRGLRTFLHAAGTYLPIALALVWVNRRAVRSMAHATPVVVTLALAAYSIYVGGDSWEWMPQTNRYLTAVLPLLLVAAAGTLGGVAGERKELAVVGIVSCVILMRLVVLTALADGWLNYLRIAAVVIIVLAASGRRGFTALAMAVAIFATMSLPGYENWLRTGGIHVRDDGAASRLGVRIAQTTRADARIAVVLAGAIPYFADRPAVDILGKNDPVIAMRKPVLEFYPGHDRFDYEYSIGTLRPDLVTQTWQHPKLYFEALKRHEYVRVWETIFSRPGTGSVDAERLRTLLVKDAADDLRDFVDSRSIEH